MENFNQDNHQNKGAAAPTTTPKAKTTKRNFKDNSAHNQRLKLLDWLQEKNSITTAQARECLDIMSPAPRVLELRKAGYLIDTVPDTWTSEHGINHKGVARYVLTQKEPIELEKNSEVTA